VRDFVVYFQTVADLHLLIVFLFLLDFIKTLIKLFFKLRLLEEKLPLATSFDWMDVVCPELLLIDSSFII
jgi:hypothetical protein